jgi:hypothetical protein
LPFLLSAVGMSQIFQNFRLSSPAPVTTMSPPGETALKRTRESCASRISAW